MEKPLVEMGNIVFIILRRIINAVSIGSGGGDIKVAIWADKMWAVKRETDAPNFIAASSRPTCTLKDEAEWVVDSP